MQPALQFMHLMPYIDSLWFGEGYNYDEAPEYWLVEMGSNPNPIPNPNPNPDPNPNPNPNPDPNPNPGPKPKPKPNQVEMSGIAFGLMGDMMHAGNMWRGMLYGMTTRFRCAG